MTIKLGVIGDSGSDAYRGTDNRAGGTQYADATLNWIELLVRLRGVDCGAWGSYAEPRRTDYAHNWARSAARSDTMLTQGQHTGLAAQVASGAVDYCVIWIGVNDFQPSGGRWDLDDVYAGTGETAAFYASLIVPDILTAVDALIAEGPSGIICSNYTWQDGDLTAHNAYPDPTGVARLEANANGINAVLIPELQSRGVAVWDFQDIWRTLGHWRNGANTFLWWDQTVNDLTTGNDPLHFRIADGSHYSTIVNWWLAMEIIKTLNANFATPGAPLVKPLHPAEVLSLVGTGGLYGSVRRG